METKTPIRIHATRNLAARTVANAGVDSRLGHERRFHELSQVRYRDRRRDTLRQMLCVCYERTARVEAAYQPFLEADLREAVADALGGEAA